LDDSREEDFIKLSTKSFLFEPGRGTHKLHVNRTGPAGMAESYQPYKLATHREPIDPVMFEKAAVFQNQH
jgi:hypothetical protein